MKVYGKAERPQNRMHRYRMHASQARLHISLCCNLIILYVHTHTHIHAQVGEIPLFHQVFLQAD